MTNREIKFELAKASLLGGVCTSSLKELYDWIIDGDVVDVDTEKTDYDDKQIGELLQYIATTRNWNGRGYATKLESIFSNNGIETVGDLLRIGKTAFLSIRNVGRGSITCIDDALKELYGLNNWYK